MATVTSEQELRDAIAAVDPQIVVANDIALTTAITVNYDLELTSNGSVLSWAGVANRTMFSVTNGATFTIADIVLDGMEKYATLVSVAASTFVMNDGAVLRKVSTNSANNALKIGNLSNPGIGGTFHMNGGLITGVLLDAVISCTGGNITMSGDAAIAQNQAYGIGIHQGTLTMTGSSRISDNTAARPGVGVLASGNTVINMGLTEGDAPQISDNTSTDSYGGGLYITDGSELNMNYRAQISGNAAPTMAGGVVLNNAVLHMRGNAVISGNTAQNGGGGGVFGTGVSTITIADDALVSGNRVLSATGKGGGVYLQQDSTAITISGSATISDNSAADGGGIYLNTGTSLLMGTDAADTVSLTGNSAGNAGGGIYINTGAAAHLMTNSVVSGNTAGTAGAGIYDAGKLQICHGVQIADGLYYNSETDAPIVSDAFAETASIQLESSDYVDPVNIPIVLATKGDSCPDLTETDQSRFLLPDAFAAATPVYRNAANDQILAGMTITLSDMRFEIRRIDPN